MSKNSFFLIFLADEAVVDLYNSTKIILAQTFDLSEGSTLLLMHGKKLHALSIFPIKPFLTPLICLGLLI
ncbi:MAG: hypothetical protein M1114_01950 [Candidatus Dependentiae bacterium]|nr:hypothetical protein [Candidatus Dependentiae bacterium]